MWRIAVAVVGAGCVAQAQAQWVMQESHTTASLRGIHAVSKNVAWASGTQGTVLRTVDGGKDWQVCVVPPGAEALDFRGVQAFDAQTAIVMSSGKGDLSRLYKTTDGCGTWKLVFVNPDKEGFWDAMRFSDRSYGVLAGDQVGGRLYVRWTADGGKTWNAYQGAEALETPDAAAGLFAASNGSIAMPKNPNFYYLAANVSGKATVLTATFESLPCTRKGTNVSPCPRDFSWDKEAERVLPFDASTLARGVFAIGVDATDPGKLVAVGGDYSHPELRSSVAAYECAEREWCSAERPPSGYRSSVQFDTQTKSWFTVGSNGTDVSADDGRNWRALKPGAGDAVDADKNWNALSLPFVVGPKGRIGVLREVVLGVKQ